MDAPAAEPTNETPSAVSTDLIGFPMVEVELPANSSPTGFGFLPVAGCVTIKDPESPPLLKVLELIWNCFTNFAVLVPRPHGPYPETFTVTLTAPIVPFVKAVVRPLFSTLRPTEGLRVVALNVPISSILPVVLTCPEMILAIAASTVLFPPVKFSLTNFDRCATLMVPVFEQTGTVSTYPRCIIVSPALPALERARTWLLLRMYMLPLVSFTKEPSVPVQQKEALMSFTLLPLVPSLIGGDCCAVLPAKPRVAPQKNKTSQSAVH